MKRMRFAALLAVSLVAAPAWAQAPKFVPPTTDRTKVESGSYKIEGWHARLIWSISHLGFSQFYGRVTQFDATLTLDAKHPSKSALDVTIPIASITSDNAKLDGELQSPMWFNAAQFPTATYKSTKIVVTGRSTGTVTGDLTLMGVTKPVTLKIKLIGAGQMPHPPMPEGYIAGFQAEGHFKRSDFGLKTYLPLIGDDVDLIIAAPFQKAS